MAEDAKVAINNIAAQNNKIISGNTSTKSIPAPANPYQNRRVNQPLGTSSGSAFSLKNVINKEQNTKVEEEVYRDDLPKNDYTLEDVQNSWNKFLSKLKAENNIPSYNALATTKISLKEDNVIVLEFISASSETEYDIYKNRIMNGLRTGLNNYYFTIEIQFSQAEAENHILTAKQKFEMFVEKNPILLQLKEEFGLDLYE